MTTKINPATLRASARRARSPSGRCSSLAQQTTTGLTADEIHGLGLREVARIRGEMATLKNSVSFDGDLKAFFEFLGTDRRFFFPNTEEGRQAYIDASHRCDRQH